MKKAICLLMPFVLFSCNYNKQTKVVDMKKNRLESYLFSSFSGNTDLGSNSVVDSKINDRFKSDISDSLKHGIISDYNCEFIDVLPYKNDLYMAQFRNQVSDTLSFKLHFDVFAIVSSKYTSTLKKGSVYMVQGSFKKFYTVSDLPPCQTPYTIDVKLSKAVEGSLSDTKNEVLLGCMLFDKCDIKLIKN